MNLSKEDAMERWEEEIGEVDHYYSHLHVAGIWVKSGKLKMGDQVHIRGFTTDMQETVTSMQLNHEDIMEAGRGEHIGIPVHGKVRNHDRVFIIHQ
jgi:putative protease